MATVRFREVAIRGVRRWKDADGKKHQETRKFWQTISPFNKNAGGYPKNYSEIMDELMAERDQWLKEAPKDGYELPTPPRYDEEYKDAMNKLDSKE